MAESETARQRWARENKAKIAEYQRRYRATAKGKAARAAASRRYRKRHPARVKAAMVGWLAKHPTYERDRARQRYAKNPGRQQAATRRWRERNQDVARQHGVRAMTARRLRKYGGSSPKLTNAEWLAIKLEYEGRCAYCFEVTARPTQEHVVPLARGGEHTRTNVVPACLGCNRSKGTKDLIIWLFPEGCRRG